MGKFKAFLIKHEAKLALFVGFILVASISFQAGYLEGGKNQKKPIIIEKPIESLVTNQNLPEGQILTPEATNDANSSNTQTKDCAFVGSKNSNKYHLPTCRYAKNIDPKNLVCFSSQDEAKSKGYLPDKNCVK